MARSKLYDKGRGGSDREDEADETAPGDEPEPATRVRGKSEAGEPAMLGGGAAEGEHEAMFKAQEGERRDMHGRHRTEHRDMEARHKEERAGITDHESMVHVHRKHEHEHRAMRHKHLHEHTEMLHRHMTAIHDLHQRQETGGAEMEKEAA